MNFLYKFLNVYLVLSIKYLELSKQNIAVSYCYFFQREIPIGPMGEISSEKRNIVTYKPQKIISRRKIYQYMMLQKCYFGGGCYEEIRNIILNLWLFFVKNIEKG